MSVLRTSEQLTEVALFDCVADSGPVDVLAMDFFDEETLAVMV